MGVIEYVDDAVTMNVRYVVSWCPRLPCFLPSCYSIDDIA